MKISSLRTVFKLLTIAAVVLVFLTQNAFAADPTKPTATDTKDQATTSDYYINASDTKLNLSSSTGTPGQISSIVTSVVNVLFFAAGAAAVIFLAYGGVTYIASGGDETKTASARKVMINAFIGVVLVSMTYTIFRAATKLGSNFATGINQSVDQ